MVGLGRISVIKFGEEALFLFFFNLAGTTLAFSKLTLLKSMRELFFKLLFYKLIKMYFNRNSEELIKVCLFMAKKKSENTDKQNKEN